MSLKSPDKWIEKVQSEKYNKHNDKMVDMLIEGLEMWRCEACFEGDIDCSKCILDEEPINDMKKCISYCEMLSELWGWLHDYKEHRKGGGIGEG